MSRRPGESSKRRFRELRRDRIREQWREFVVLAVLLAGSAAWVVFADGVGQIIAAVLLGATGTFLVVGWLLGFDARSLRWMWGAIGEEWTATELERLGPEWTVFHDLPDGKSNWDHVVVGPSGVFVIDSKSLVEPATIDESGLRAGRLRFGGAATRGSAVRLKEAIEHQGGSSVWVQGVVCVWGELRGGTAEHDRVLYAPGSLLTETLASRPARLTPAQIANTRAAIEAIAGEHRVASRDHP